MGSTVPFFKRGVIMQEVLRREKNIKRKVLVVDDEVVNRRLLGFIISRDYDVIYAENGVQALELIKENERTLSLILLDLLMPEMDGYEVLKQLHSDPELRKKAQRYRVSSLVLRTLSQSRTICRKLYLQEYTALLSLQKIISLSTRPRTTLSQGFIPKISSSNTADSTTVFVPMSAWMPLS